MARTQIDASLIAALNTTFIGGRNRIINGGMEIDQMNGGSAVNVGGGGFAYGPDMLVGASSGGTTGTFSLQRLSATPPTNFVNYVRVSCVTADASIASTDEYDMRSDVEGYNVRDFAMGTANAQVITLSFWVRSSLTGTYSGSIQNAAQDRSYPFEYSISVANTWEKKTVTLTGDVGGTWGNTTGVGLRVRFAFAVGASFANPANVWGAGNAVGTTNQVNFMSSNSGRTWDMTGLQLEVGSKATPFEFRTYHAELNLCQRYFEKSYGRDQNPGSAVAANAHSGPGAVTNSATTVTRFSPVFFKATKRATPTITLWDTAGVINKLFTTSTTDVNTSRNATVSTPNEYEFTPRSDQGTDLYCGGVQWQADARL